MKFFSLLFFAATTVAAKLLVRRDIMTYTDDEKNDLILRLNILKSNGKYDLFSAIHGDIRVFRQVHHTPLFLPWHRMLTFSAEKELRDALPPTDPPFTIPYWNSSRDSGAEGWSPMWGFMGPASGAPLDQYCLDESWVAMWRNAKGQCVSRVANASVTFPPWQEVSAAVLKPGVPFLQASKYIEETPHDHVHLHIAGTLRTFASSDDPLFFLIHAYIDKIWDTWQKETENDAGPGVIRREDMPNTTLTVTQVWSAAAMGYTYA